MRTLHRVLLGIVASVLILTVVVAGGVFWLARRSWPRIDGTLRADGLQEEVRIVRDSWGVPHIYANTAHDLFFAQGFAHAQDRFWQMEFWRRIGSGRLAEILGESAVESDRFIRTVGWHRTAARELELLDDQSRAVLEAYAQGVNSYIASQRGRLGLEFTVLGLTGVKFEPEPWTPLHSHTWAKVMAWDLGGNMDSELVRAHIAARLGLPAVEVLTARYPADSPVIVPEPLSGAALQAVPRAAFETHVLGSGEGIGSNNWVVSGSRTESGQPLLANDTHLGIQMPSIWYEVGLHCQSPGPECPYNVTGFSFAGAPGVVIGHNDRIAWGVTNLGPDVQDLFVERINPDNPNQYEFQGQWLDMEIIREEIAVAGRDEDDPPEVVHVRITRHGPIINDVAGGPESDWAFGWQPLALSWTALQPGTTIRAIHELDKAQNWDEFRQALSHWSVPSQNFVYADIEGNIGYQAPGRIPIRAAGDGSMPAPGWNGEYDWVGYIPFDELPRTFNPDEGYIVTANHAVVGPDFPYFISKDWAPGYRAQRIVQLIEGDPSLSVSDMQRFQGDSVSVWWSKLQRHLASLVHPEDQRSAEALDVLKAWDGRETRDSAGAMLAESFRIHLVRRTFGDEVGEQLLKSAGGYLVVLLDQILDDQSASWFDDVNTPSQETRDEMMLLALDEAVQELTEKLGSNMAKWRWGDLHTATFTNGSLGECGIGPIEALFNRGPVAVDGSSFAVNATSYRMSAPYVVTGVPSQRQIVDLSDFNRSLSLHTTGQSGHPFNRHYDDMINPWRNIEYHAMLWNRTAVEADAEGTLVLQP